MISNTRAIELFRRRIIYSENAFAELVLWRVNLPVSGAWHCYKYRLAYVVNEVCVLRYDNEAGKGDHRHYADSESGCLFSGPEKLLSDFLNEIERWNRENSNS